MINFFRRSTYKIDKKRIIGEITKTLKKNGLNEDHDLNIIFTGKRKIREINKKFRNEDIAIPVLSFSYLNQKEKQDNLIGEIFICYPLAVLLAAEREKEVDAVIIDLINHGINNILKFS